MMKKLITILLVLLMLSGCGQQNVQTLVTRGSLEQILNELTVGNPAGALAPFGTDVRSEELEKQLNEYSALLNGRAAQNIDCVSYEQSGTIKEGTYEETACYEITLEDGTMLYAKCYETATSDRVGLVSFQLFTECPW